MQKLTSRHRPNTDPTRQTQGAKFWPTTCATDIWAKSRSPGVAVCGEETGDCPWAGRRNRLTEVFWFRRTGHIYFQKVLKFFMKPIPQPRPSSRCVIRSLILSISPPSRKIPLHPLHFSTSMPSMSVMIIMSAHFGHFISALFGSVIATSLGQL